MLVVLQGQRRMGADVHHDIIPRRNLVLLEAHGLAEKALDAVATDGGADAATNGEAKAGHWGVVGPGEEDEGAGAVELAGVVDCVEVVPAADAARARKAEGRWRWLGRRFRHESALPAGDGGQ